MEAIINKNVVNLRGKVVSDFEFNHEIYGEKFFIFNLAVDRLSNSTDIIPVVVSERLIDVSDEITGRYVAVTGQFRSYNQHTADKSHLFLYVFSTSIDVLSELEFTPVNNISLDGYICKKPIYRTTPLGREIADVLLAVNRPFRKTDYIPCVLWGRNAKFCERISVGTKVKVDGRLQSREYTKVIGDTSETRIAYEVSVGKVEVVENA